MTLAGITGWLKGQRWNALWRVVWMICLAGLFVVGVPGTRPDIQAGDFQTISRARDNLFDFALWEGAALLDKTANAAVAPQRLMTEPERVRFVREYLQLVDDILRLERQVRDVYTDPAVADPAAASAALRAERDALRTQQLERQALAEAIIESQVSAELAEAGFSLGGQAWPPVAIRFTQLPSMLIVSPRDRIERTGAYPLEHGLTVDQQEALESAVDSQQNTSSLVVPIGGLAVWPAMLIETGHIPYVFEITAHEWAHHHLSLYPLGFNYGQTPELYTMNETVASIVGTEVGWAVLSRYYPDLAPEPPDFSPQPVTPPAEPAEPTGFDFRAEMRETRIRVDELLAAGQIAEAEQYMEMRRAMFVENGYRIRKLNQAYFAFYGSYADQPGATGADPIGPALRELRFYSPSLQDYIHLVRGLTSFNEVQAALDDLRARSGSGG